MAEQTEIENQFKVKLQHPTDRNRRVVFEVTPDLIENRTVTYKSLDPIHMPGQIFVYGSTSSRTFNISAIRLVSRTPQEAQKNLEILHILRFWCMPRFGRQSHPEDRSLGVLGQPPDVILLSAYSKSPGSTIRQNDRMQEMGHLNRVPVVITNLSTPYPSDIDYIPTSKDKIPMPTIMSLDLTLNETHSPLEYENFSLAAFKNGTLPGF